MADRRYLADDNVEWASRYEYEVFRELQRMGVPVRKCEQGGSDTFTYTSKVQKGLCMDCASEEVVQRRTYTPDIQIDQTFPGYAGPSYIEAKGLWRPPQRNLLRRVIKCNPDLTLLFVFYKDGWITKGKTKYSDYIRKYFPGCSYVIWSSTPRLLPGEKRGGKKGTLPLVLPG